MTNIIHSVQLWERITGKKAPYSYRWVDSSHRPSEKEVNWLDQMFKTIQEYNPESHGYKFIGRAKFIGLFYETPNAKDENERRTQKTQRGDLTAR